MVRDILIKDLDYRPWKPKSVQELYHEDKDRLLEYGEMMVQMAEDQPDIYKNIVWTDEATFHVGGFVKRHNSHYWGKEDPKRLLKKSQNKPRLTVWVGITSQRIIGPVIIKETMNGERYLHLLENTVFPKLHELDPNGELIFMQDGAPAHYATAVRQRLDEEFPGRWLGRRGPYEWPARSCDLTPCDFFLWG